VRKDTTDLTFAKTPVGVAPAVDPIGA
jgi:hypothetical protein